MSAKGVEPNPGKVSAILQLPEPTSVTEIKSIMGMVNFYRRFIPRCSNLGEPLFVLYQNGAKFVWSIKQSIAFQQIKVAMTKTPVLQFPAWDRLFYVETDASGVGLGTALTQDHRADVWLPVGYVSRTR